MNFLDRVAHTVISEEQARRFHSDGANRLRLLRRKMWNGHNLDSQDFRGVRAALVVAGTLAHEVDNDGKRLPYSPDQVRQHMDLGITAIQEAGLTPLSIPFREGYDRMADAFSRPPEAPANPQDTQA